MKTIEQWEAEAMRLAEEYGGLKWDEGLAGGVFDSLGRRRFQEEAAETLSTLSAHLATHPGRQGEDAKDAERYRWLREQHHFAFGARTPTEMDAQVDAAMPKEPTHASSTGEGK